MSGSEQNQHPLSIYYSVWILLFVVSGFSYAVDYYQLQGTLRWTLILIFMFVKAYFITAIFMHMTWERKALQLAILLPLVFVVIFIGLMAIESDYTFLTRVEFFTESDFVPVYHNSGAEH